MEKRALIPAVAALCTLLGCAGTNVKPLDVETQAKKPSKKDCRRGEPSGSCLVNVWVKCAAFVPCWIEVDRDFVIVYKDAKPDIFWQLTPPTDPSHPTNAAFKFDEVILVDPDDKEQFTDCKIAPSSDGRRFSCKDNQRNVDETVVYKYTIKVKDSSTFPVTIAPLDPFVINN